MAEVFDPLASVYGVIVEVKDVKVMHIVVEPLVLVSGGNAEEVAVQPVAPVVYPFA